MSSRLQSMLLLLCSFTIGTIFSMRVITDYDLWWHLAVGRFIVQTQTIPVEDIFSFSLPRYPYIYQAWLTDISLYTIYRNLGLWGISVFYATLTALGVFLQIITVSRNMRRRAPFVAWLILVSIFTYIVHTRTQAISFFLLSASVFLIDLAVSHKKIWLLWFLPIISVIWVNTHGGFLAGVIIVGILLLDMILASPKVKTIKTVALILVSTIGATLANPYGVSTHIQAIAMATNKSLLANNPDWSPLLTGDPVTIVFSLLLGIGCIMAITPPRKMSGIRKTLIVALFFLSLLSRRFVLPLSVLLVVNVMTVITDALLTLLPHVSILVLPGILSLIALAIAISGRTMAILYEMPAIYRSEHTYTRSLPTLLFPTGAVDYMATHGGLPSRLLNDANWGGYLEWRFPDHRIFIDGRMDAFFIHGISFAQTYTDLIKGSPGWKQIFDTYQFDGVLAPSSSPWPIINQLVTHYHWSVAYQDAVSILLIPPRLTY